MFLTRVLQAKPLGPQGKPLLGNLAETLTPLRFFLACICEGLGVDSGLAIWLERKRKASSSEMGDHLPGPGRPHRRAQPPPGRLWSPKRGGGAGQAWEGTFSPLLPGAHFSLSQVLPCPWFPGPGAARAPGWGWAALAPAPAPLPWSPRPEGGRWEPQPATPAPANRSPGGAGEGTGRRRRGRAGGLGFRGNRWERAWKEQMPPLPTGPARRPPARPPPGLQLPPPPTQRGWGQGGAASGSQAPLSLSGHCPGFPQKAPPRLTAAFPSQAWLQGGCSLAAQKLPSQGRGSALEGSSCPA